MPLTAIWVGGSVVTVATSLATMQLGPFAAAQRVGYVALASLSQARSLASVLLEVTVYMIMHQNTGVWHNIQPENALQPCPLQLSLRAE